jgi:hypothetical protein
MIQEITTEERKYLEMSYYQRDSQLERVTVSDALSFVYLKFYSSHSYF